jgi:hypothetical protein
VPVLLLPAARASFCFLSISARKCGSVTYIAVVGCNDYRSARKFYR